MKLCPKAKVLGTEVSTTSSNGTYGYDPYIFYVPDPNGNNSGNTIDFYLSGNTKVASYKFETGASTRLDLFIGVAPFCGDSVCNGSETCSSCSQDCGSCTLQDFSLNNSNAIFVSLVGGAPSVSTETAITLTPSGTFASDVALSVDSINPALSGATFNFADSSLSSAEYSGGTKFSVNVPAGTPSGLYTITIKGDGGGLIRTINVQLNIEAVEPSWIEI